MSLRSGRPRASAGPGFTLIEMLIVAVILTTIAAVAAPRYASSLMHYRIEAAAARITTDLAAARGAARAQSAAVTVTFGASGYRIEQMQAIDAAGEYGVNLREPPYSIHSLSFDLGGPDTLTFDGYGALDRSGTITITLGGRERTVTVDRDSGRARVKR